MGCGITQGTVSGPYLLNCIESPINADHSRFISHIEILYILASHCVE